MRRCCALIVVTGVQIPLAMIRRGVNSWKILPTWTGVFLIRIKSGVSRLKFRALVLTKSTKGAESIDIYGGKLHFHAPIGAFVSISTSSIGIKYFDWLGSMRILQNMLVHLLSGAFFLKQKLKDCYLFLLFCNNNEKIFLCHVGICIKNYPCGRAPINYNNNTFLLGRTE